MQATDVAPTPPRGGEGGGQEGHPRPRRLGPHARRADGRGGHAARPDERRHVASSSAPLDSIKATDARADFPRAPPLRDRHAARPRERRDRRRLRRRASARRVDASGKVHARRRREAHVRARSARQARNVGITAFSVRRYPLDKSRYEVMLEVTNTGAEHEDVELSLLGDGSLVDLTKLRLEARRAPAALLPEPLRREPHARGEHRAARRRAGRRCPPTIAPTRSCPSAGARRSSSSRRATRTSRPRCSSTSTSTCRSSRRRSTSRRSRRAAKYDVVIFDGATPAQPPRGARALPRPARARLAGRRSRRELEAARLRPHRAQAPDRALDRARRRERRRAATSSSPRPATRSSARAIEGPILVAGQRGGFKFVALGFDPRDSDLPLRVAWPLFLLNSINWFTDEDAQYISSFRTGDVWRVPVVAETRAGAAQDAGRRRAPRARCTRGARCTSASAPASTS